MQPQPTAISLSASGTTFRFERSDLAFVASDLRDVFAGKNNRSLRETIAHRCYGSLAEEAARDHAASLDLPLGSFLASLKSRGDPFYRRFLNRHGDGVFCHFRMANAEHKRKRGLYLYACEGSVRYIGRSFDAFATRVDQGYGRIHPKNCFLDGQSTNCHLNGLISVHREVVSLYVCELVDDELIRSTERELITTQRPPWNVALAR